MVDFLLQVTNGQVIIFRDPTAPGQAVFFHNRDETDIQIDFGSSSPFSISSFVVPAGTTESQMVSAGAYGDYTFEVSGLGAEIQGMLAVAQIEREANLSFFFQNNNMITGAYLKAGEQIRFQTNPKGTVYVDFDGHRPLSTDEFVKLPAIFEVTGERTATADTTGTFTFRARLQYTASNTREQDRQSGGTLQGDIIVDPPT